MMTPGDDTAAGAPAADDTELTAPPTTALAWSRDEPDTEPDWATPAIGY